MWWYRLFRCWHNEWIYRDIQKNRNLGKSHEILDDILLRIIYHWNPKSRTLPSLYKAIELCNYKENIFTIDLITRCALQIDITKEYYVAWKIINLMTDRCVKEENEFNNYPHFGMIIEKMIRYVNKMTESIPLFLVSINKTVKNEDRILFKEIVIENEKSLFKEFIQERQDKEFLDVFGYILDFIIKLVSFNILQYPQSKLNTLFGITVQFRIEALGKINGKNYRQFLDNVLLNDFFQFPTTNSIDKDSNMKWMIHCSI